jgi:hypothetical protein
MTKEIAVMTSSEDKGKKVYRQISRYYLTLEQDVIADSEDEAFTKLCDGGGIDYQALNRDVTHTSCDVETLHVDADWYESDPIELIGTVDEEGNVE